MSSIVYIAGAGVISAIGNNVAEHLTAFEREEAGMGDITMLNTIHKGELPVAEVKLTDAELQAKTPEFKQRIAGGEALDAILPEAFAVCREASRRVLKMRHFDVQLIGGMALHFGKIADGAVTFSAQPLRIARAFDGKSPQEAGRGGLPRLASAEEIDRPGRARPPRRVRLGRSEELDHRRLLHAGRGTRIQSPIERSEGFHTSPSAVASPAA